MALAIRLEHLLASGQVTDQAEIARAAGITRARITQILNLTNLAPDI
jgi:predicted XRE-type DNA-binding protein